MTNQTFNINEAAKKLNVSTRTIRRYIKAGKLKAELVKGSFGDEYRILELPTQIDPNFAVESEEETESDLIINQPDIHSDSLALIRELQAQNLSLAVQLGAAAERIKGLELQVKLLAPPKSEKQASTSFFKRLFGRRKEAN